MKHIRQAEDRAEALAEFREEEVLFLGHDIHQAELYEHAYRDFAELGRVKLARKRRAFNTKEPLYYYVVICTDKRAGRIHRHLYQTSGKVTRIEALAAGSRKHPKATVTVIPRKGLSA